MQRLVCIMHSYRLAAIMVKMELVYGYIVVNSSYNLSKYTVTKISN